MASPTFDSKTVEDGNKWLALAQATYAKKCSGMDRRGCYKVAQASMGRGNSDEAMLLSLHLCGMGEMLNNGKDIKGYTPCSWHTTFGKEPALVKRFVMDKFCKKENRQACLASVSYIHGSKTPSNQSAVQTKLCVNGYFDACTAECMRYALTEKIKKTKKVTEALSVGCDRGEAICCSAIAGIHENNKNALEASKFRMKSCNLDKNHCDWKSPLRK